MQYELEIEMKNLLTVDEFNRLKDYFSFQEKDFITQINYYFETKNSDFSKTDGTCVFVRKKINSP